jgi:hypothetical protein
MKPEVISTIYDETVARRELPVNFQTKDSVLFEGEFVRVIPSTQLLKFEDVLASPEGLLFKGTRILPESFAFPYHLDEWRFSSVLKFLAINAFRRRRKIECEALWITDYWSTGYFHWVTDVLTRLFAVRDRLNDLLLVLPGTYERRDVVQSALKAFGVSEVDFVSANEVVQFRSLVMPSHTAPSGHFKDEAIRGVRDVLLSAYGDPLGKDERLYISRHSAGRRRIVNEDEVTSVLRQFGFVTICAEDFSFAEQVAICSRARYVVSNHGAGLTNVLFMKAGGSVLELRHEADCVNNCYFTLSSALDLHYYYQTCTPQDPEADPHDAHVLVDVDQLKNNLTLLVS